MCETEIYLLCTSIHYIAFMIRMSALLHVKAIFFFAKNVKYKMKFLLRLIHHFKTDLINNMDHMRISGTDQWSLTKQSSFKNLKVLSQKCPNKLKPKGMV